MIADRRGAILPRVGLANGISPKFLGPQTFAFRWFSIGLHGRSVASLEDIVDNMRQLKEHRLYGIKALYVIHLGLDSPVGTTQGYKVDDKRYAVVSGERTVYRARSLCNHVRALLTHAHDTRHVYYAASRRVA
jgi:hypothetical protein